MLILQNIQKKYGATAILNIDKLELPQGIYWLKGANGSGKTTFFKMLAGLIPFEGQISLAGLDIRQQPIAYRQCVNYSPAEPHFPPFLTGNDLIQFIAKTKKADPKTVQQLIETLDIGGYLHRAVGTYSSGMLKKLSLMLGFMGQPKLIVLDEPLITIDVAAVQNMIKLIHEYHQKGSLILLSSHQNFDNQSDILISKTLLVHHQTVEFAL
ncbi:MAG: hypothetical protein RL329_1742 [Bacteroidota bacterium]|jgi:ABC-2 type transport system ATP-binding protein